MFVGHLPAVSAQDRISEIRSPIILVTAGEGQRVVDNGSPPHPPQCSLQPEENIRNLNSELLYNLSGIRIQK